ncbi:MAG: single-stranded DNA exonuclease RecJ, partial [Candidatus Saccharibacteria bacterium]|nr:single-stranded DNA exonuclease RecJ [Candidatus Saccharibacteria bacterium]
IAAMEPFGNGNPEPILSTQNLRVVYVKKMGAESQHVKLGLQDLDGTRMNLVAFNAPEYFFAETGERVTAWYQPILNEWQGRCTVEGRLLRLERA